MAKTLKNGLPALGDILRSLRQFGVWEDGGPVPLVLLRKDGVLALVKWSAAWGRRGGQRLSLHKAGKTDLQGHSPARVLPS